MMRLTALSLVLGLGGCRAVERAAVRLLDDGYEADGSAGFDGADAERPRLAVDLALVATGLPEATDIQFAPGTSNPAVVLTKAGAAYTVDVESGQVTPWFEVSVHTVSEQGLLGLAFHPDFADNGRFFINHIPTSVRPESTVIDEYRADAVGSPVVKVQTVLTIEQPYQNHNGGQLAFGPDGMLYIGMGDGGLKDDPAGNGQNADTLLGSMLRIDVNGTERPYSVPADNPFVGQSGVRPEAWAIGLRNPWRFSFAPDGQMVVADVGQDTWEELSIATAGANLGWNIREGEVCFPVGATDCPSEPFIAPFHVYDHDDGKSITGGYVVTDPVLPDLNGLYVFADFTTGRLWAIALPSNGAVAGPLHALGKRPMLVSTFGQSADGRTYIADYGEGQLHRLVAAPDVTP